MLLSTKKIFSVINVNKGSFYIFISIYLIVVVCCALYETVSMWTQWAI